MTTTETRPSTQIREEHGGIKALLTELESVDRFPAMLEAITTLGTRLEGHFAFEESEGGMASVVRDNAPERMDELDALFAEHAELREDLGALESGLRRVLEQRAMLIARIRAHEAKESDLLTGALYDDLGACD